MTTTYPSAASAVRDAGLGLRERKKQRTRETLIDAATRLCVEQGYDNTTVEQIAGAAEVSPRTFSRYFPTKEAVIVAIIEESAERIGQAVARQPHDITEHDALVRAHVEVFRAAERGEPGAMSFGRVTGLLQIVNSSPALGLATFAFQADGPTRATVEAMARRMGVSVHHPAVRILFDTWAVLMASACSGLGTAAGPPAAEGIVCDRIEETYAVFSRLWQPWQTRQQPPAGGSGH